MAKNKTLPKVSSWKSEKAYTYKDRSAISKPVAGKPDKIYQPIYNAFAAKLRMLIEIGSTNQSQLANAISAETDGGGPPQSVVNRWYHAEGMPKWEHLLALKKLFNVTLDYLIDPSVENPDRLTEQEQEILSVAEMIGFDVAKKRMLLLPGSIANLEEQPPEPTLKPKPAQGGKKNTKPA